MVFNRKFVLLALLLAAVLTAVCGCASASQIPELADSVRGCRDYAEAKRGDVFDTEFYELTAMQETQQLTIDSEAYIKSWKASPGQAVRAGDVIVELEYASNGSISTAPVTEDEDDGYTLEKKRLEYEISRTEYGIISASGGSGKEAEYRRELARIESELKRLEYENALAEAGIGTAQEGQDADGSETGLTDGAPAKTGTFTVTAPFDGTVTYRSMAVEGDFLPMMTCVAAVSGGDTFLYGSFLTESQLAAADGIFAWISGEKTELEKLPYSDDDYNRKRARFTVPGVSIEPGSDIGAYIYSNTEKDVIYIPTDAIRADRNGYFVYVLSADGTDERRAVSIGTVNPVSAIILSGITEGEQILVSDIARNSDEATGTAAFTDTFAMQNDYKATAVYFNTTSLSFDQEEVTFGRFLVEEGAHVKAGDVLAECEVILSEEEVEAERAAAERLTAEMEQLRERYDAEISALEKQQKTLSGEMKTLCGLEIELKTLEAEHQLADYSSRLERAEDAVSVWEGKKSANSITAPMDGVIDSLAYVKAGDTVSSHRWMIKMHSETDEYLKVTDKKSELNSLMKVTVMADYGKTFYTGRVVQADNVLWSDIAAGTAYVLLDDESVVLSELVNPTVLTVKPVLENALLVKRTSVLTAKGRKYVMLLEDGVVGKRYVTVGPNDSDYVCILSGITDGDIVADQ